MILSPILKSGLIVTALFAGNAQANTVEFYEAAAKAEISHCLDQLSSIKANTPIEIDLTFESCGDGRNYTTAHVLANACPDGSICPTIQSEIATVGFLCNDKLEERVCNILPACSSDRDCSDNSWCRPTKNRRSDKSECVPYVNSGDECQGFQDDFYQMRCGPSLKCDQQWQGMDSSAEPGACVAAEFPCTVNEDCSDGSWCRKVDVTGTISECVAYRVAGEGCSGFVPIYMQHRCDPSLTCQSPDPKLPDLAGICQLGLPVEPGCVTDSECDSSSWCRPVDDLGTVKQCVLYRSQGESCGGFFPLSMQNRCDPTLTCISSDESLPDSPGTCEETEGGGDSTGESSAEDEEEGEDPGTPVSAISSTSLSSGAIAGISVSGIIVLVAVVASLALLGSKRRGSKTAGDDVESDAASTNNKSLKSEATSDVESGL